MRLAGVMGWPVAHSKSPIIHRFWLDSLGIDGDYARLPVRPDALGPALRALPALGFSGVNLTVPHKVTALAHVDRLTAVAREVGAINIVTVAADGRLEGDNSDVAGFLEPLQDLPPAPPGCLADLYYVVGTGGAARAVCAALRGQEVTVFGRDRAKADALADAFGAGARDGGSASLEALSPVATRRAVPGPIRAGGDERHRVILINATSLGMQGQPPLEIDLGRWGPHTIVYDLVYAPIETPLLAEARARGMRTIDGLHMLIGQAAVAFEAFYGASPPRERDPELRVLLAEGRP